MMDFKPVSSMTCDVVDFSREIIHPNIPDRFMEERKTLNENECPDFEKGSLPAAGNGLHASCAIIGAGYPCAPARDGCVRFHIQI